MKASGVMAALADLPPGSFLTVSKVRPAGSLVARRESSGAVAMYWRYSLGTRSERVKIGLLDGAAPPKSMSKTTLGYSIAAATRAAEELAVEHYENRGSGGRPAIVAANRAEALAAAEAEEQAREHTFEKLLTGYCDYLEALGRRSHADARSIFRLHVVGTRPDLATTAANGIKPEQIADLMRALIETGKGRTANKLRAYISAAFGVARSSRFRADVPVSFQAFAVTINPADDTRPDERHNKPDKQPLNIDELRKYWQVLEATSGFRGAVLRLHLLGGGQRIEQLVRLKTRDIQDQAIVIYDGKGRPGKPPRPHAVPMIESAEAALKTCLPTGEWALSTDGGDTHLAATTLSRWAVEAGQSAGVRDFATKRIRSGIETALAAARVSADHRGRLQSHGVSGVQARHYDGHDYMPEKREALILLHQLLTATHSGRTAVD